MEVTEYIRITIPWWAYVLALAVFAVLLLVAISLIRRRR
jgi:hypothetical protein